ncbi:hypothetical protein WJX79_007075 [Trebouxia sp. C0005]
MHTPDEGSRYQQYMAVGQAHIHVHCRIIMDCGNDLLDCHRGSVVQADSLLRHDMLGRLDNCAWQTYLQRENPQLC